MNNRNLGILIAVIAIAAGAICFAIFKTNQGRTVDSTAVIAESAVPASIEPSAGADKTDAKPKAADAASQAAPTSPAAPSAQDPVVAKVNGDNVLRSDAINYAKTFPPQLQQLPPEQLFPIALEQAVAAKIVDQKASKEADLSADPEVAKREADAKVQIIRTVYLEKEIDKRLTDDRVQKAYDKFKTEQGKIEEVHARHILVDSEDKAKDIIKKIQGGAKFEDLAKENSKDTSNKDSGGDLGYFTKDAMVKEFADAAFAMNKDDVSKAPVKTQFGYHVIQVLDKRTRPVPTLAEIKPQLVAEEKHQILNEMVEDWRKKADVQTFDINGKPVVKKEEVKKDDAAKDEAPPAGVKTDSKPVEKPDTPDKK